MQNNKTDVASRLEYARTHLVQVTRAKFHPGKSQAVGFLVFQDSFRLITYLNSTFYQMESFRSL